MKERLDNITDRIKNAALSSGRDPGAVRLVSVSKTVAADRVRQAVEAGAAILGENYIQEARKKFNDLIDLSVSWHFIGHLQSNKAKYAVRLFDLIHSVDSLKLARALDKCAGKIGKVQEILIQVNISREASKSGAEAEETAKLVQEISRLDNLSVRGLMTMPPFFDDPDRARPYFQALRDLRDRIRAMDIPNVSMEELSMGMTGDFEAAVEEGATLVRVGTAIFGERI
ncbi:MAG: YggS family pyridoxal phosphate-dependent enzyme [Desulfobacterales bacterium]|nr:YggS family pyridoxal phosphate-dependent enzyme [Desulfobacterales bacterium]